MLSRPPSDRRRCYCYDQPVIMASPLSEEENVHTPLVDSVKANYGYLPSPTRPDSTYSKPLSGTGSEPLNIVILGASFGGLSCAHHFLDYTIEQLRKTTTAPNYRLVIVSPSTHIYWVSLSISGALNLDTS